MRAVSVLSRLSLQRRFGSVAMLSALLALSGTLVLAVTAGALRDGNAMDRLLSASRPATAVVVPNIAQPSVTRYPIDWHRIAALPEVAALTVTSINDPYEINGIDFGDVGFPAASPDAFVNVERGVVLSGRRMDNSKVDEAVANEPFMRKYDLRVGDTLTARMYARDQLDTNQAHPLRNPGSAAGPTQQIQIVGVVRLPWVFAFDGTEYPKIYASHAFFKQYRKSFSPNHNFPFYINALVRLRSGEGDLPEFSKDVARITGRHDIDITDLAEGSKRVSNATSFERDSLLVFAFIAAVAALVIAGPVVVRYTESSLRNFGVLQALGVTRRQAAAAAIAGPLLAAAVAATVAVAGAFLASSLFPIGMGATVEPDPGRDADWSVLTPGALGLMLAVALIAWAAAVGSLWRADSGITFRRSLVATWTSRLGFPIPMTLGRRLALEKGHGRSAIPVRPAIIASVGGVVGLVAAATFHVGLTGALTTPERYGQSWQAAGIVGVNNHDFASSATIATVLTSLADRPEVAAVNDTHFQSAAVNGRPLIAFELSPVGGGSVEPVSVNGHPPETDDEIALAPLTAERLGVRVGQWVEAQGERKTSLRVTGVAFVPSFSYNSYDDGAWLTDQGLSRLYPSGSFKVHAFLVRFRPGTDARSAVTAIKNSGLGIQRDTPPTDVVNLRTIRRLPTVMGAFLALLAVGAVGHALAAAVHRRRRDTAVLRTLGMTGHQVRAMFASQATTLAVVALVLGIPLGLVVGRRLWHIVADNTPLLYVPPFTPLVIVLVIPLSILAVNVLAAYPAHHAVHQRISTLLRTE
jgi:hypothetical protein